MSNKPKIKVAKNKFPIGLKEFEFRAGIRENMSCREQLELALVQCSKGAVPDYLSLQNWFSAKVKEDKYTPFLDEDFSQISIRAAATAVLCELSTKCNRSYNPGDDYTDYMKLKLLISLFSQGERGKEAVANLLKGSLASEKTNLKSDIRKSTPSELRQMFFTAIHSSNHKLAIKIIGMLQNFQEVHDSGELDYLEALSYYKSNDFDLAIEYAEKVAKGTIDYNNALRISVESNAFLGNIDKAINKLTELEVANITEAHLVYIYEVLCVNSENPEETANKFRDEVLGDRARIIVDTKDPGFRRFAKFHANLLIRFYERYELGLRKIECEAGNLISETCDLGGEIIHDLEFRRLWAALAFDQSILTDLKEGKRSERILLLLLQGDEQPDFESYFIALQAQFRLDNHHYFLENMVRLKPYLTQVTDSRKVDLYAAAYQAATISEAPEKAEEFLQLLQQSSQEKNVEYHKTKARELAIAKKLTPMGRESYEGANTALVLATKDGKWRDAGMISLGYFRILEMELNSRLIVPLSRIEDIGISSEVWLENRNKLLLLLEQSIAKSKAEKIRTTIETWTNIVEGIKRIMSGKEHGLVLGYLNRFLNKLKSVDGEDAEIKEFYRRRLCALLTEEGVEALRSGELASVIDEKITPKFRNAPAHSRFVPLEIANQCKSHVDSSLERLFIWIAGYNIHD